MPLTDDAKAEIREAIRIVREDRFEKFVRTSHANANPPKDPADPPKDPADPPKDPADPPKDPINPPPPKDPNDPKDPPNVNPPKRSSYWGELLDD